jgi:hypothetical protein
MLNRFLSEAPKTVKHVCNEGATRASPVAYLKVTLVTRS